mgnify:CR=1 FL=1
MKYRKNPIVIDAIQWEGTKQSWDKIFEMAEGKMKWSAGEMGSKTFIIHTLEGEMLASNGDWIIKGVNGELYPCKPDIFEKTYESVE